MRLSEKQRAQLRALVQGGVMANSGKRVELKDWARAGGAGSDG